MAQLNEIALIIIIFYIYLLQTHIISLRQYAP